MVSGGSGSVGRGTGLGVVCRYGTVPVGSAGGTVPGVVVMGTVPGCSAGSVHQASG